MTDAPVRVLSARGSELESRFAFSAFISFFPILVAMASGLEASRRAALKRSSSRGAIARSARARSSAIRSNSSGPGR